MSDEIQDRPNSHRERLPSWRHVIWRQLTWRKVLAATLVIVLLCLLATPTIVNRSWCRLWILDKISGNIKGHFSATDWRFGWWVAPRCQQFRIHPPQGASLLELPSLSGNRTLLQWLFTRDLGDFQIERPLLRYEETPDGSNFARTFNEPPPRLREYLKKLVSIGVLVEQQVGRERLFVHPKLIQLITKETNIFKVY